MTKIKDTDYLTISARIRAMENRLLTRERMERMLEARADEEAAKVLTECGYGELPSLTHSGLDEMLSAARGVLYKELKGAVPDKRLVEVFQMKYDYHNAKTLIKAAAVGTEADRLLMGGRALDRHSDQGRLPARQLAGLYRSLPPGRCPGQRAAQRRGRPPTGRLCAGSGLF